MPLVFMMGRSPAILPDDRQYARNHMWALPVGAALRYGLSAYAVRLLGDLRSLEWSVAPGVEVAAQQVLGSVEGSKAVSDLYAPAGGRLLRLNPDVPADPTLLNSNLYDSGWLFEFEATAAGLLSPADYVRHLEQCWPIAQRILKGQVAGS